MINKETKIRKLKEEIKEIKLTEKEEFMYANAPCEESNIFNSGIFKETENSLELESESMILINTPIHTQIKSNIFYS